MTSCTATPSFAAGSGRTLGFVDAAARACLDKPRLSMMGRLARAFRLGLRRRAAIRALSSLDGRLLADIGIDPANVEAETDALLARMTSEED
jgi:uncharacterized protein YjiS (DUF1127 family)